METLLARSVYSAIASYRYHRAVSGEVHEALRYGLVVQKVEGFSPSRIKIYASWNEQNSVPPSAKLKFNQKEKQSQYAECEIFLGS